MRDPYPRHGRRWSIWHPFSWSCRCGQGAYPCHVEQTWKRWQGAVEAARDWRDEQRRAVS